MSNKKINIIVHITFAILILVVFIPFFGVVMVSVTDAGIVEEYGYSFLPREYSFEAYKVLLSDIWPMLRATLLTIFTTCFRVSLTVALTSIAAYAISSPNFVYKRFVNIFLLIPLVFHAGLAPTYILKARVLGLDDSIWIYMLPTVGSWSVILWRTYFKGIPSALWEASRIDGATDMQTFLRIYAPMSKAMFGMTFCTGFLQGWNDFSVPLYYITDSKLLNIQAFLQEILREANTINEIYKESAIVMGKALPTETIPYAAAILSCVPIFILFPWMQKYFTKGISAGGVKG